MNIDKEVLRCVDSVEIQMKGSKKVGVLLKIVCVGGLTFQTKAFRWTSFLSELLHFLSHLLHTSFVRAPFSCRRVM